MLNPKIATATVGRITSTISLCLLLGLILAGVPVIDSIFWVSLAMLLLHGLALGSQLIRQVESGEWFDRAALCYGGSFIFLLIATLDWSAIGRWNDDFLMLAASLFLWSLSFMIASLFMNAQEKQAKVIAFSMEMDEILTDLPESANMLFNGDSDLRKWIFRLRGRRTMSMFVKGLVLAAGAWWLYTLGMVLPAIPYVFLPAMVLAYLEVKELLHSRLHWKYTVAQLSKLGDPMKVHDEIVAQLPAALYTFEDQLVLAEYWLDLSRLEYGAITPLASVISIKEDPPDSCEYYLDLGHRNISLGRISDDTAIPYFQAIMSHSNAANETSLVLSKTLDIVTA